MSHLYYKPKKTRLQRSELAVPGSSPKMFEKALNSNADYIFLDLEDAVSPNDKISARNNIITALRDLNWKDKGKTISVRINSLDTHYMYSDVVEIIEKVGDMVDTILIPKVGTSSHETALENSCWGNDTWSWLEVLVRIHGNSHGPPKSKSHLRADPKQHVH